MLRRPFAGRLPSFPNHNTLPCTSRSFERPRDPTQKSWALARTLGKIGRRLYLVSVAVAAYEIWEADDKPMEVARKGVIGVAGLLGGLAGGTAADVVDHRICLADPSTIR